MWLTMGADEAALYQIHCCADGVPKWADTNRMTACTLADLAEGISRRRAALAHSYAERAVTGSTALQPRTLLRPGPGELRPVACAAYQRLARRFGEATVPAARANLTKYKALLADIAALRASSPGASVVVFTHHNEVLDEVAKLLTAADPANYTVFNVSRRDAPASRHSKLRLFQSSGGAQTKIFATTFSTAAVGLTLTAATRVYLLEASLDPAQEAQAAGRIHRLGQTKEVLVKRLLYRGSLDEAVHELHSKIRSGELTLSNGTFPREALDVFVRHGVAQPHEADDTKPTALTQRRYRSFDERNCARFGGDGGFDYGKAVQTRPCRTCGKAVEVPGTSVWWGKGRWVALNGDTSDTPELLKTMESSQRGSGSDDE